MPSSSPRRKANSRYGKHVANPPPREIQNQGGTGEQAYIHTPKAACRGYAITLQQTHRDPR